MTGPNALSAFMDRHRQVMQVELTRVRGSSPREAGAEMFVSSDDLHGTIGGGQLEYRAIERARVMLESGAISDVMDIPLGPEIGQCCGGRVELRLTRMSRANMAVALRRAARAQAARPEVLIFGAGHVGRALARFLELLPVRAVLIDSRAAELRQCCADVECRQSALPEVDVRRAAPGSAFVVLTHDHALDFLVTSEALARGDAAYVGMIGSATKRAKFSSWCRNYCDGQSTEALVCPMGVSASRDKRPEVIAAMIAAEVIAVLSRTPACTAADPPARTFQPMRPQAERLAGPN